MQKVYVCEKTYGNSLDVDQLNFALSSKPNARVIEIIPYGDKDSYGVIAVIEYD